METQLKNSFFTLSFVSTVLSCIWNLICGVLDLIASSVLTSTGLATSKTDDGLNLALAQLQETFMNTNNVNTNNQENNISPQVSVKLENECEQTPSMIESPVEVKFIEEISHQEFINKIEQSLDSIPTSTSSGSSLASSIDEDSENEEDDLFHEAELAFPDEKADPESVANVEVKEKAKKKRRRGKKKSQKLREQIAREREAMIAAGLNPDEVQIPSLTSSSEQISPRSITVTAVKSQTPEKKQQTPKKQPQPQPQSPTKQSKKDKESKSNQGKSDSLKWEKDASRKFSHSALKHDKMEEKVELNGDKDVKVARQPIGPSLGNNGFSADYQKSRRAFMRN